MSISFGGSVICCPRLHGNDAALQPDEFRAVIWNVAAHAFHFSQPT
jgi:hypothetical protein